jgi:hypothetical protein
LRGDGAGDGGAREDPIECLSPYDAWAGWLGRDGARERGARSGIDEPKCLSLWGLAAAWAGSKVED